MNAKTNEFDYIAVGRSLDDRQRHMYFELGAEIQNSKSRRLGFLVSPNWCHETALAMLESVDWTSLMAARSMTTITRNW